MNSSEKISSSKEMAMSFTYYEMSSRSPKWCLTVLQTKVGKSVHYNYISCILFFNFNINSLQNVLFKTTSLVIINLFCKFDNTSCWCTWGKWQVYQVHHKFIYHFNESNLHFQLHIYSFFQRSFNVNYSSIPSIRKGFIFFLAILGNRD